MFVEREAVLLVPLQQCNHYCISDMTRGEGRTDDNSCRDENCIVNIFNSGGCGQLECSYGYVRCITLVSEGSGGWRRFLLVCTVPEQYFLPNLFEPLSQVISYPFETYLVVPMCIYVRSLNNVSCYSWHLHYMARQKKKLY